MTFVDLDWITGALTTPDDRTDNHKRALAISDELIHELLEADEVIVGTPMYNFAIPAVLKAWVDHVVRFGKTFKYGSAGREGLAKGRKVIIVVASGQKYDAASGLLAYDFEIPYLRHILGFIGITDITFIQAGGTMQVAQEQVSADEFMAPLLQQITDAV
jgi:FMN-dependent NADH-azoreductase